jgi:hypothetical protein
MRRRFGDRILAACAVALLGSLALVPTQTLAGSSHSGNSGSTHGQQASDHRGDGDGGDSHRNHGHDKGTRNRESNAVTGCDDGGEDHAGSCGGGRSRPVAGAEGALVATGPGASASAPGRVRAATSATSVRAGTAPGSATAPSSSSASVATRVASSAGSIALVQGVSLPGVPVHVSRPPAANPAGVRPPVAVPSAPAPHPVLGPVPVLVPSIGVTVSPATSSLAWEWLVALAIVGVLLGLVMVVRRRRARAGPLRP